MDIETLVAWPDRGSSADVSSSSPALESTHRSKAVAIKSRTIWARIWAVGIVWKSCAIVSQMNSDTMVGGAGAVVMIGSCWSGSFTDNGLSTSMIGVFRFSFLCAVAVAVAVAVDLMAEMVCRITDLDAKYWYRRWTLGRTVKEREKEITVDYLSEFQGDHG
eukprot:scaffold421263_cov54-Attheya_sp.AAC.3